MRYVLPDIECEHCILQMVYCEYVKVGELLWCVVVFSSACVMFFRSASGKVTPSGEYGVVTGPSTYNLTALVSSTPFKCLMSPHVSCFFATLL